MVKQFFSFVKKEALHIWRDPRTLLILFGIPIVQIMLFGFALTNEVKNSRIAILDPSKDAFTTKLTQRFESSKYFETQQTLQSPAQLHQEFQQGKIKMAVVFAPNAEKELRQFNKTTIQLISDASDPNVATTLTFYASAIIGDYQKELLGQELPYTIQPQVRMLYNPQLKGAFNFVPGVMAMILLLVCTMMTSISIVREKENGTMELLLASPLKPGLVIVAKAVPYFLLSVVNIISILLLSVFVLGLPIAGSVVLLMGLSMLFIITALSLGLLISNVTDSQRTAMFISLVGMFLPTLMFSGFMFPVENMPLLLQGISKVVPATWYYTIVKSVMIKGLGFHAIWKETLILTGMTLFFLLLAIKNFKIRLQ